MANHVYFNIELSLDAGQTALVEKLSNSCKEKQGQMEWLTYAVEKLPIYSTPYDEDDWYSWGCENIGAKWISVDDWNETTISGHSAWSPVIPFVNSLIQYIYDEVGGMPTAKMTYEDEFRNFIGIHEAWIDTDVGSGEVNFDYDEYEGEDLNQLMLEAFDKTDDWFESDDFDWWESYPIKMEDHAYKDEMWEPQQYCDELVYQYFDSGNLEHLR